MIKTNITDYKHLGLVLKSLREANNLEQAQLAHVIGVSERSIRRWENGEGVINSFILITILNHLKASLIVEGNINAN